MGSKYCDIVVVGGGHAGVEAAIISSKLGCSVSLVTMDKGAIGRMSCNPAIGGLAKGQMVRELNVLGGVMPEVADISGLQFKTLNKKKGRAVWSPRAQVDKRVYEKTIYKKLKPLNVSIVEGEVVRLNIKNHKVIGVFLRGGDLIHCQSAIITVGTFLSGTIHIGERKILAGRMGEERSEGLTAHLNSLGFKSGKLKTGTPPRLIKKTINWEKVTPTYGDKNPTPFSYFTNKFNPPNHPCHTTQTNKNTHFKIQDNLSSSPMFSGDIEGTGPRYCPSIEDKVFRFSSPPSHTLHLEPEWKNSDQIYLNGFSTSLPEGVQIQSLRSVVGLEAVEFFRPGYAIEYDFFPPAQLKASLETKDISGLFFAGQMNGTSGYEEAAAQGLICGINAVQKIKNNDPLILPRDSSYIGVMIDDLITKDTNEPYRMFTSRAEYRLLLRFSNTFERLHRYAKNLKLLSPQKLCFLESLFLEKEEINSNLMSKINHTTERGVKITMPAKKIIKRTGVSITDMPKNLFKTKRPHPSWLKKDIVYDIESDIKYEGYIKRHLKEIKSIKKRESLLISKSIDYSSVPGLSKEAIEKLTLVRPETLGQATRVSGITPADTAVLHVYISK